MDGVRYVLSVMDRETIVYDGIKWHRYPSAPGKSDQRYYISGKGRLHRYIYEKEHGKIPPRWCVHHKDGDWNNNDISNLEAMPLTAHNTHHHKGQGTDAKRRHMARIQDLARAWHGSEEGRKWHSEHSKRIAAGRQPKEGTCDFCGRVYLSMKPMRFCSQLCKSRNRDKSRKDDEQRKCQNCGGEFMVNRYTKTSHCSKKCAAQTRSKMSRNGGWCE